MKNVKAIVFDVNGVLEIGHKTSVIGGNQFTKEIHKSIARHFNLSLKKWFSLLFDCHDDMKKSIFEKHLENLSNKLGTSRKKLEKLFLIAYKKYFRENKELYSLAFNLQKKGYKIAILSDQWHLSKNALIPKKLSKHFDQVLISCDVGIRKPNPAIYKLILKKLKFSAKSCVFIDNQEWNIKSAKKLGMKTILFKNNKQAFKQLFRMLK